MDKFTSMTKSKRLLLPLLLATSLILPMQIQVQAMPDTNNPAPAQEQPQEQTDQQTPSQGEPRTDRPSPSPSEPQTDQPSPSTSEPQTDKPSPSPSEPKTDKPAPSPSEFETKPESSPAGTDASMLTVTPEVADGSSIANAIPFVAPGPQTEAISANGYTYFSVPFTANRPITFTVSPSSTVYLYNATSTSSLASGAGTVTYKSTTAATYYVKVPGVAGDTTTLSSVNGASFAQAYETGYDGIGPKTVTMTIPSTTTSYYKVQLLEGIKYSFSATGASIPGSVSLFDESQVKIGGTTGTAAYSYVPTVTGTYYVALKAGGTTGDYNLKLTQYGTTTDTATAYPMPGSVTGLITDAGYSFFSVPLKAKRTYYFDSSNTSQLALCTSGCNDFLSYGHSLFSYVPSADGTYYLKASGLPGDTATITSIDGSSFAAAYETKYDGVGSKDEIESIPGYATSYFKIQLLEGIAYSFSAVGPSTPGSVTLHDEALNKLSSATGISPASFTPTLSGTYYVALKAGGTGGQYTLKLVQNGTSTSTAYPFLMPGPQTSTILDPGRTYFSLALKGNRTYYFNSTNTNQSIICTTDCKDILVNGYSSISFSPTADGTYYLGTIGTPGATTTISSVDGTTFDQAYDTAYIGVGPKDVKDYIPSTSNSYFKLKLLAGITYQFSTVGPSTPGNISLYDETQKLLGSATGISPISYTPSVNGTYYINIKAGGTGGQYTLKMTQVGATTETAYTFNMPGPQIGLITDAGYTYYTVPLKAYRTYFFNSTNTNQLDLCTSGCSNIVAGGNTSFSYKPTADTTYYLRTVGTPGDSTSLTSIDGSTFAQSYESSYMGAGTKSMINGIPALQSSYYKVLLQGGTTYTISATGPVTPGSLTAYDSTQTQVGTPTTGSTAMTLTAPADGLYYIALKAGGSNGDYTLKVVQN
jgi:hypothetical protein